MIRLKSMRPTVAVLVVAVLIVAAGGAAVASNMGFKFNKPLVRVGELGAGFWAGIQYASIPYNTPYGTINGFCTQTGLVSTGITRTRIGTKNYTTFNENAPFATTVCNCGAPGLCDRPLLAGKMLEIRQPCGPASVGCTPVAGSANSMIIVGSHNSSSSVLVTENFDVWFSVPYHTTAVTSDDLCLQVGLTRAGITRGRVERLNPLTPGSPFQTYVCGTTANLFNLVLGEGIVLREANGDNTNVRSFTFVPAHY